MGSMVAAFLGLAFGSFANVCIDRVPEGKSLRGRSACDRCRRTLRWWELVPVVSALILRHRCPTCAGAIPFRNTAVELAAAALVVAIVWRHGGAFTFPGAIESFGLITILALAIIDLRRGIVPDQMTLPAIAIIAIAKFFYFFLFTSYFPNAVFSLGLSMALGAGFFAVQRLASRGRWVGDGDIRVGALMGALLPIPLLAVALAASYVVGGAVAGVLLATGRARRGSHLPLVPFLFVGTLVAVFWGGAIIAWYGLA